jgi:hypothetical protein
VTVNVKDSIDNDDDELSAFSRKKTPMPRIRKAKLPTDDELDENGIIDRDEDLYDDNDDVSTSTLRGSDESLQDYINEENKINQSKSNAQIMNEKMKKFKKFMTNVKDKSKGLSCRTADTVIDEYPAENMNENHKKSCAIM